MTCLHCGAPTTNGLGLCELCQRKATLDLEFVPVYFRNLSRWKPGRAGSRPVPDSREPSSLRVGGDDKVIRALDEAHNALTTWARTLVEAQPHFPRPLTFPDAVLTGDLPDGMSLDQAEIATWLCVAFERHLTSIATLDWCGEFVREVGQHEAVLRGLTEQVAPGWYAGACRRCGVPTHVIPGLTWVTCSGCGATTYARDHLDTVLDEARGWVAPPKRISEAIVALVDTEQSTTRLYERIKKWWQRGQIAPIRTSERQHVWDPGVKRVVVATVETGRARYRLGDVLDRLFAEGATSTSDSDSDTAEAGVAPAS